MLATGIGVEGWAGDGPIWQGSIITMQYLPWGLGLGLGSSSRVHYLHQDLGLPQLPVHNTWLGRLGSQWNYTTISISKTSYNQNLPQIHTPLT